MNTYIYRNADNEKVTSTDRITANNEAYWANSNVVVKDSKGETVKVFTPFKIDTVNLICGGFHNHEIQTH